MASYAHLSTEHAPLANLRRASDTHLSRHDGIFADIGIVGNLHQVVELDALADVGATHSRTVYARIGSYLHIVLDGDDAYLWNLVVALWGGGEAETIGAYNTTGMERYPRAQTTIVIDNRIG